MEVSLLSELKVGVVGLGSMGWRHAEAYRRLAGVRLVAASTRDPERRQEAQQAWGIETVADYRELVGRVDAVTIATPTYTHAEITEFFAGAGVHVLVEKPIAATQQEAARVVAAAEKANICLMVGHVERFNPAFIRLAASMKALRAKDAPVRIKGYRMGPYDGRIHDVCVVLDLMIHDVDLVTALHPGDTWQIHQALGMAVVTPRTDIGQVAFELYAEGTPPANVQLLASRANEIRRRVIEVNCGNFSGKADLLEQRVWLANGTKDYVETNVERGSPLDLQLAHFVASVRSGTPPAVSGQMGAQALKICLDVARTIQKP